IANIGLRIDAVGEAGLVIPLIAEAGDVQQVGRERGAFLNADGVGVYVGSAGMLESAGGAAVLLSLPVTTLGIVAAGEVVGGVACVYHLVKKDVVFDCRFVVVAAQRKKIRGGGEKGFRGRGKSEQNRIPGIFALPVVAKKKKHRVFNPRPADIPAELVEV